MLSMALRQRTLDLHKVAERSGIIALMLRGRATLRGYGLYLRNLLPCYEALEAGLSERAGQGGAGRLAFAEVNRVAAIRADLSALEAMALPVLPQAQAHAADIRAAAVGDGAGLIGHAYARTLGDLSGGQILQRLLGERMGLAGDALAFYRFPGIADLEGFKLSYRAAIDAAGLEIADVPQALNAAEAAFRHTIALSEAVAELEERK